MRLPDFPASSHSTLVICLMDEVFRDAVANVAEGLGYLVAAHVRHGNDLLELLKDEQPAAALVDLALLGVDGLGTVRRIGQAAPATTIVLSSPFASVVDSAVESGAHHVVSEGDVAAVRAVLSGLASSLPSATTGRRSTKAPSS